MCVTCIIQNPLYILCFCQLPQLTSKRQNVANKFVMLRRKGRLPNPNYAVCSPSGEHYGSLNEPTCITSSGQVYCTNSTIILYVHTYCMYCTMESYDGTCTHAHIHTHTHTHTHTHIHTHTHTHTHKHTHTHAHTHTHTHTPLTAHHKG